MRSDIPIRRARGMIERNPPRIQQSERDDALSSYGLLVLIFLWIFRPLNNIKKRMLVLSSHLFKQLSSAFSSWKFENKQARERKGNICTYLLWFLLVVLLVLFMVSLIFLALDYFSGFI